MRISGGGRARRLTAATLLGALLTTIGLVVVTQLWDQPLHVPFQYAQTPGDDQQDATLDMMLVKNIAETGWFSSNPSLNAPFAQHWAEWPMGGDLLAYGLKKTIVDVTGDVPFTLNLFWLLTFPLVALVAVPALRALRCSPSTAVVGGVLYALAPYHFRNGTGHSNLAFYVGVPVIVIAGVRMLGPPPALPVLAELRSRAGWRSIRWLLLGSALVAVTGIYYLAFLLTVTTTCAVIGACTRRSPGRLVVAATIAVSGLAVAALANLPTILFRADHAANLLGVPDRRPAVSEGYPLRLVELLSPVAGHRVAPLAWVSDQLSAVGRHGLGTANLGLAAAIGFCIGIGALVLAPFTRRDRGSWQLETRLGVVMLVAFLFGVGGGLSRVMELLGLQGVRAWNRIAIVIAFAAVAVFARTLDRVRVSRSLRARLRRPRAWYPVCAVVLVIGVLDQTSGAILPDPRAVEAAWRADHAFVARLERHLPRGAAVFELPVADFPEHGAGHRMSDHDLIKETYLHSSTLRWSAGGIRGRSTEWQWPASQLTLRSLVRGLVAMGFTGLMLDRYGYADDARHEARALRRWLGAPLDREGDRLLAWDLRRAAPTVVAGLDDPAVRARVRRGMLDAPRLYLDADASPITDRGDAHGVCRDARLQLVDPGRRPRAVVVVLRLTRGHSDASGGTARVGGRAVRLAVDGPTRVRLTLHPGITRVPVVVRNPGVRCDNVQHEDLPTIAARLVPRGP
jgi:phosphoglycerol transferase